MAINIGFFEGVRKQLETEVNLFFSSCYPFPSYQSAGKDACQQFQCSNIANTH